MLLCNLYAVYSLTVLVVGTGINMAFVYPVMVSSMRAPHMMGEAIGGIVGAAFGALIGAALPIAILVVINGGACRAAKPAS